MGRLMAAPGWWPIPQDYGITAHFGDYRWDGRVHTGLDFSTNLRIGLPVRVWKAGTIVRLRVDHLGYGRALYVKHPDGLTTVYAHLDRFENERLRLEDFVRRLRQRTERLFLGDVFLDAPIPVEDHQVIAYTGESGSGRPHLHFEIRDAQEVPLNPMDWGIISPYDRQRPVIQGVVFVPARADTFLDGRPEALVLEPSPRKAVDTYPRPVTVTGPVDLFIAVLEPSVRPYRRTPARLEVRLDDQTLYVWQPRAVPFDARNRTGFVYHLGLPGPTAWVPVLRVTGSAPAPRGLVERGLEGPLDLTPGLHQIRIIAESRQGGRAEFQVPVRRIDKSLGRGKWEMGHGTWDIGGRRWFRVGPVLTASDAPAGPVWAWTWQGAVLRAPPTYVHSTASDDDSAEARWSCPTPTECYRQWLWDEVPHIPPAWVAQYGPWYTLQVPETARPYEWHFERFVWTIPPRGLWEPAVLTAIPTSEPSLPSGLVPWTPVYRLEPSGLPFQAPHRLTWQAPAEARAKPLGLFVFHSKRQKWLLAGTLPEAPLTVSLWHPLTVVVAEDQAPPRIQKERTLTWDWNRWPLIRIFVEEVGLGLREDRIAFAWDGTPVTDPEQVYYDPDWEAVVFRPPEKPPPGGYTATLYVEDWAGLTDRAEFRIRVLP
ncbi:MAG: M23 family metallopeptidase [Acidobacteria bacterium]|nr:M23 family metallopeptidase [Acidobacteriota bacterium]MDW7983223.1 M23 family metallopeptidase [Acidobacteriota bacterium]